MNDSFPIPPPQYKLSDDAIKSIQILVKKELEKVLKDVSLDEVVLKNYQKTLDTYMMKQYPDLSNRLNQMALDLKDSINKTEQKLKDLVFREKTLLKSDCLYEDVYKLRDEFKEIQKFMEGFQKKLKKVFEV